MVWFSEERRKSGKKEELYINWKNTKYNRITLRKKERKKERRKF